jgi:hypothetical protein
MGSFWVSGGNIYTYSMYMSSQDAGATWFDISTRMVDSIYEPTWTSTYNTVYANSADWLSTGEAADGFSETFTGDGSEKRFESTYALTSGANVIVTIGGVVQTPVHFDALSTGHYALSANAARGDKADLCFSTAPANTEPIELRHFNFLKGNDVTYNNSYNISNSALSAFYTRQTVVPTDGQSTVNLDITKPYIKGLLEVYLNGILLRDGVDYTANGGTVITMSQSSWSSSDLLDIIAPVHHTLFAIPNAVYTREQPALTNGSGAVTLTNTYTPGLIQVYLNGILLEDGLEYTATNGTSITMSSTVWDADDELDIIAYTNVQLLSAATWSANGNDIYSNNSGNVGIGTSSPEATLTVVGSISAQGDITTSSVGAKVNMHASDHGYGTIEIGGLSGGFIDFKKPESDDMDARIQYVSGLTEDGTSSGSLHIITQNWADIQLQTNTTTRMIVASGGNVGIGTGTPAYKLDVNGDIRTVSSATEGLRFGDDVLIWSNGAGTLTQQAIGNSSQSDYHLQVTAGTLPTGTLCEYVLARTTDQAFGGNYGRWSFTALGSSLNNVSGIYGEFGGTVDATEFIFNYGIEDPASTFTSYEPMRLMADVNIGNVGFGVGATTPREVIQLHVANIGTAGTRDSHSLLWRGKAYDSSEHAVDWKQYIDVTANDGTSTFLIQNRIDSASYDTKLAIDTDGITVVGNISATGVIHGGTPGAVTMYRTSASTNNADPDIFTVSLPDGTQLDTTGTLTGGLQEAIDYANNNGFDFYCHGGGIEATSPATDVGVITCTHTLSCPPCQNRSFTFKSVTLNFTNALGSNPGLLFDSFMMLDWDFRGQVVYQGGGAAVRFAAANNVPYDNVLTQVDSNIRIDTVAYLGNTSSSVMGTDVDSACVYFAGAMHRCKLHFGELNGSNWDKDTQVVTTSANYGVFAASSEFKHNIIDIVGIHNVKKSGIQVGTSTSITPNGNTWRIGVIEPDGNYGSTATTGIDTFGNGNSYDFAVTNGAGAYSYGIKGNTDAAYEYVLMRQVISPSVASILDGTTSNTSIIWLGNTSTTM